MSEKAVSTGTPSIGAGILQGRLVADLLEAVTGTNQGLPGGVWVRVWKVYVHVWLVCLLFPVSALIQLHPDGLHVALAAVGIASFAAFYTWFMRQDPLAGSTEASRRTSLTLLAIVLETLLGLALSAMFGPAFLWLFVGVSMVAGRTLPLYRAHLVATVLPFLAIAMGLVLSGSLAGTDWLHLLPLALLTRAMGLNMLGLSLQFEVIRHLRAAQHELARQAVTEERLRLARDLHDLLGHTLSLIVLKSELAGRLVATKPDSAEKEIRELETVARQALHEVRQAVAEYRQPTLYSELDGARQMLDAAGITFSLEKTAEPIPPSVESVLAWVVREGVTNVIRHSRARYCRIRITRDTHFVLAEITNDGYAEQAGSGDSASSGLAGLKERVDAQGGTVQAGPCMTDGLQMFLLKVKLPVQRAVERG